MAATATSSLIPTAYTDSTDPTKPKIVNPNQAANDAMTSQLNAMAAAAPQVPKDAATLQAQQQQAQDASTQLPNQQDGSQTVKLTKQAYGAAPSGQAGQTTEQLNDAVMKAAQTTALNQQTNPLNAAVDQQTQKFVSDPNLGFDYAKYNQAQLEQTDQNNAKAAEAARQQLANTSQSGELQNDFMKNILTNQQARGTQKAQLDYEANQAQQKNLIAALNEGRSTSAADTASTTGAINNMLNTRGAFEGERSQTQGFQDDVALSNLGFDHQTQLAAQQGGIDLNKMNAQYGLEATKAAVAHGYDLDSMSKQFGNDMTKLMATQDFEGAQSQLTRETQIAMQSNDINATSANIQKQLAYDKWAQENGQTFTAEQNAMNRTLEVSMKNLDIQGQKDLMNLKGNIDTGMLMTTQDFTAAQASLDRAEKVALQQGDIAGQLQIQEQKGVIDSLAQTAQNEFVKTQTTATQAWQTGERVGAETFTKNAQYYDWAQKNNAQTADFANQQTILQQNMNFDERMKAVDADIAEAKASNDNVRLTQLTGYKAGLDEVAAINAGVRTMDLATLNGIIEQGLQTSQNTANQSLENLRAYNELQIKTQDMNFDERMKTVDADIAEAKASNDNVRLTQLTGYKAGLDEVAATNAGVRTMDLATLNGTIEQGLQTSQNTANQSLENLRAYNELQIKTQDMKQEEKMAYINAGIDEAKASNDTARQMQLISFSTTQDINKMAAANGYDQANAELNNRLSIALQNNDAANVLALTNVQHQFQSSEHNKDLVMDQLRIGLEGKQIEIQNQQMTFDQIEAGIAAGQIAPEAAQAAIQKAANQYGIQIKQPDPLAAQQKIDADFKLQLHQYGLTHPGSVIKDAKGNDTLAPTAVQAYNDFVNNTIYGTDGTGTDAIAKLESGDVPISTLRGAEETPKYQAVLKNAAVVNIKTGNDSNTFESIPKEGSLINIDGKLYQAGSAGELRLRDVNGVQFFWVTDVNTGKTGKVTARGVGMDASFLAAYQPPQPTVKPVTVGSSVTPSLIK